MNTAEMFEAASRMKLRFETPKGLLSVEDLWDIPLAPLARNSTHINLDSITIALHHQTKQASDTVSFVTNTETRDTTELNLKFEIAKHIISVRVRERDELKAQADRREKKQQLLEIIDRKQNQELEGKSVEELRAMVESL